MKTIIDACGCSCPEPVLKTKQAIDQGSAHIEILVDNPTASQNIARFAKSRNYTSSEHHEDNCIRITLMK